MKKSKIISSLAALGLVWGSAAGSQAGQQASTSEPKARTSSLEEWWNGKWASGNWFGVRDTLED
ncbi:MAG: hypothetical protein WBL39_23045, partial [Terrimicrobiaceae bacterium]